MFCLARGRGRRGLDGHMPGKRPRRVFEMRRETIKTRAFCGAFVALGAQPMNNLTAYPPVLPRSASAALRGASAVLLRHFCGPAAQKNNLRSCFFATPADTKLCVFCYCQGALPPLFASQTS